MEKIVNDYQIEEIMRGIVEADSGDFASDKEVERALRKWAPSITKANR